MEKKNFDLVVFYDVGVLCDEDGELYPGIMHHVAQLTKNARATAVITDSGAGIGSYVASRLDIEHVLYDAGKTITQRLQSAMTLAEVAPERTLYVGAENFNHQRDAVTCGVTYRAPWQAFGSVV